jgi:hypothetical protein
MYSTQIYFYLHPQHFPSNIPETSEQNWSGFALGIYTWTIQTYLRLKQAGLPCFLVDKIPEEGIVFVHRNLLTRYHSTFKPGQKLLLVNLKAELLPFPSAQIQVVQNPTEVQQVYNSYYLPHWTQPGLIARDKYRREKFKNIAFFGHQNNLAPELRSSNWQEQLNQLGLNWLPIINQNAWNDYQSLNSNWNDYSQIDAVVAVRSFGKNNIYNNKPATKLYNAWLAGVPAILGYESAYRAEGNPNQDYLEVTTLDELLSALVRLKQDIKLRQLIIQNGYQKAEAFNSEVFTQRWCDFIENVVIPAYQRWCHLSPWQQQVILGKSRLNTLVYRVKLKLKEKT